MKKWNIGNLWKKYKYVGLVVLAGLALMLLPGKKSDAQTQEAMHLLARTEAIFVDPCYTGKSFHGFVDLAQNVFPKGSGAIYLHTGGIPAIWTKEHLDAAQPVLAAY